MGRRCKVCDSLHVADYDQKILSGWVVKEVWKYAMREHQMIVSYEAFRNHANNCVRGMVQESRYASRLRQKKIDEEIQRDIQLVKQLTDNLSLCNEQVSKLKDVEDPEARGEVREIIGRINQTVDLLLKFSDKLNIKPAVSEDELYDRVVRCMEDFPPEWILKFREKWSLYGPRREEQVR